MLPFAHASIGYLLYAGYLHARFRRSPDELAVVLVAVGTQTPDLIDKPLALVGVLESGRSLGHSFLFAVPLILLFGGISQWRSGNTGPATAFGIGHLSALLGDGVPQFFQGTLSTDLVEVGFWFWPLTVPADRIVEQLAFTPTAEYVIAQKPAWTAAHLPAGKEFVFWIDVFQIGITLFAAGVWLSQGMPGWQLTRETIQRFRRGDGEPHQRSGE